MITINVADLQRRAERANSFSCSLELNATGLAAIPAGWLKNVSRDHKNIDISGAFRIKACSELLIPLLSLKISSAVRCG